MKYLNALPGRKELHAGKCLSRDEHRRYLQLCELGEAIALHLHGLLKHRDRSKVEWALREIITSGHDLQDGSIFDCNFCWESARHYRRTGHLNIPTPAARNHEPVEAFEHIKLHL